MTGYIYTFSSFLLHIHRGFALLLPSRAPWVFRTFNALPWPTNLHGGSPIICFRPGALTRFPGRQTSMVVRPLICFCPAGPNTAHPSARPFASIPVMFIALGCSVESSFSGLGPTWGCLRAGRLFPVLLMFLPSGSLCPELQRALQPCCRSQCFLPASSRPRKE